MVEEVLDDCLWRQFAVPKTVSERGAIGRDQIGIEKACDGLVDFGKSLWETERGGVLSVMCCVRYNT